MQLGMKPILAFLHESTTYCGKCLVTKPGGEQSGKEEGLKISSWQLSIHNLEAHNHLGYPKVCSIQSSDRRGKEVERNHLPHQQTNSEFVCALTFPICRPNFVNFFHWFTGCNNWIKAWNNGPPEFCNVKMATTHAQESNCYRKKNLKKE